MYAGNNEGDTTFASSFSMPNLRSALAGFGGPGCLTPSNDPTQSGTIVPGTGACQFLNVFGTSVTTTPGSCSPTRPEMVRYVNAMDWQRFEAGRRDFRPRGVERPVRPARWQCRHRRGRPASARYLVCGLPGACRTPDRVTCRSRSPDTSASQSSKRGVPRGERTAREARWLRRSRPDGCRPLRKHGRTGP